MWKEREERMSMKMLSMLGILNNFHYPVHYMFNLFIYFVIF